MKTFFKLILIIVALILFSCKENTQDNKQDQTNKVNINAEKEAVENVMKSYKDAIQNLTTEGTMQLFTKEATVFESGGVEGTYANYVAHHLGPELDHFNSFIFSNYKIDVIIDLPFAFTTETYNYAIDIKENKEKGWEARIIKKKGVATSDLKKINGKWKITKTHSSSRNIRKPKLKK